MHRRLSKYNKTNKKNWLTKQSLVLTQLNQIRHDKTRGGKVKHELRVTSSNLRVMSLNPRVMSLNPRIMNSNSRVASSIPRVMSSNPQGTSSIPRVGD